MANIDQEETSSKDELLGSQKSEQNIKDGHKYGAGTDSFLNINERPVEDISLDFFYRPHTITLLFSITIVLFIVAFVRDCSNIQDNYKSGLICVIVFFLIISILTFPNGPFTRPHPALWRVVFGCSVIYELALLFLLFQKYETVKSIIVYFDPKLASFSIDMDKEYAVNCSDITVERIWAHVDVFALAHFLGWTFKAILIRHVGLLWAISIMWELTEISFAHLLPNFAECWWDAIILDVLVCNGLGIWLGLKICSVLEMREYKWVSIRDIKSKTGKLKRAMLQFTPESWTSVRWFYPNDTYKRVFVLTILVIFWQVSELNTFFLKHIYEFPPDHFFVSGRLLLIGVIVAPSVRQYYMYVTDPMCSRVGMQCWVYGSIMMTEAMLCFKHGRELFESTQYSNILAWVFCQATMSAICVAGCAFYHKYIAMKKSNIPIQNETNCLDGMSSSESLVDDDRIVESEETKKDL